MDQAVQKKFQITEPEDYHYLNQNANGTYTAEGISDERDWEVRGRRDARRGEEKRRGGRTD